jgi:hypothetical protein
MALYFPLCLVRPVIDNDCISTCQTIIFYPSNQSTLSQYQASTLCLLGTRSLWECDWFGNMSENLKLHSILRHVWESLKHMCMLDFLDPKHMFKPSIRWDSGWWNQLIIDHCRRYYPSYPSDRLRVTSNPHMMVQLFRAGVSSITSFLDSRIWAPKAHWPKAVPMLSLSTPLKAVKIHLHFQVPLSPVLG